MLEKIKIYYDSKTGNVERYINKMSKYCDFEFIKITPTTRVENISHFITFTTGIGEVNKKSEEFLKFEDNYRKIISVSVSGNMNWGVNFGKAGNIIEQKYSIPLIMKFELSGTKKDVEENIRRIRIMEFLNVDQEL